MGNVGVPDGNRLLSLGCPQLGCLWSSRSKSGRQTHTGTSAPTPASLSLSSPSICSSHTTNQLGRTLRWAIKTSLELKQVEKSKVQIRKRKIWVVCIGIMQLNLLLHKPLFLPESSLFPTNPNFYLLVQY